MCNALWFRYGKTLQSKQNINILFFFDYGKNNEFEC